MPLLILNNYRFLLLIRMDKGLRKLMIIPYSPIHLLKCNNMGYHIRSSGTDRWNMLYVRNAKKLDII